MVRDDEIERIAVEVVIAHEEARGWQVESVEKENRGFDLISRKPHPEDPKTVIEVRFIEVKGRAGVGEVALTANEYKTAERLKKDYWLYVVFNCATTPSQCHPRPGQLDWQPVVKVEHYRSIESIEHPALKEEPWRIPDARKIVSDQRKSPSSALCRRQPLRQLWRSPDADAHSGVPLPRFHSCRGLQPGHRLFWVKWDR